MVARKHGRVWTVKEETDIAYYLVSKPYLGKEQAKETLHQYTKRMLDALQLTNCNVKQLTNKITTMRKKYEEIKKWIGKTGQGVADDDPDSFTETVTKKCHYFYILDEILSTSQSINTSYQRHEGNVQLEDQPANNYTEDVTNPQIILENMQRSHDHVDEDDVNEADIDAEPEQQVFDETEDTNPTKKLRFAKFVSPKLNEKVESRTSAVLKLSSIVGEKFQTRAAIDEKRLQWDMEKWRLEHEEMQRSEVRKMELQLETEKLKRDVELKKLEIEDRRLRLEHIKLKVQHPEIEDL